MQSNDLSNWFGPRPIFVKCVDSTNTYIRKLYFRGYPPGTVVVAERQYAGRGRMGKKWLSHSGLGIWMSVLLPCICGYIDYSSPVYAASLSILEAVNLLTPACAEIKWPNDVLVNRKKISGILAEKIGKSPGQEMIILGIGINVNQVRADFPTYLQEKAISFKQIDNRDYSREKILSLVLERLNKYYMLYRNGGGNALFNQWLKKCTTVGRRIKFQSGSGEIIGTVEGISEMGAVTIRTDNNRFLKVFAGDMEYLFHNSDSPMN